ncbi:MAG: OmpA family protein [Hyphomonadaceae bacterium]|nr:OmpA family protein [Hyphomonadaceae bacterium]
MTPPSEEDDSRFSRVAVFLTLAALVALVSMLGPHEGSLWRLPQVLRERAMVALLASGQSGVVVEADGQRLRLSGVLESEEAIAAARRAVLTSSGPGGAWAGGVTHVDVSDLSVGDLERPFSWSARYQSQRVTLSGAAPSSAAQGAIADAARRAFSNAETADSMHVAGGAPSPEFADVARRALRALARLTSGEVRIVDQQIVFIGQGSETAVEELRAAFASPPAPFRARIDVSVEGQQSADSALQGLDMSNASVETCEAAFERLMEGNVIVFETGSATIDPSSRPILDALASVALRCDRFMIEVAGHTDNQGGHALNMELSQRRADAVADYLASQGVGPSRLTARGYGPDRPRAANTSAEGQAANRRIEFYVSS